MPSAVIRPTESLPSFVYHRAPSGPTVMPNGSDVLESRNNVRLPTVVIRPIASNVVNHNAPSGPAVMPRGIEMRPSV